MATNMNTNEIFLTGTTSISDNPAQIYTIKYDSLGNQLWAALYDSTATRGMGLAIANDGSVFVVGLNWWTVLHYGQNISTNVLPISKTNFNVFPNPANTILNIVTDKPITNGSIKLIITFGEIVLEQKNVRETVSFQLDISKLANGIFIIELCGNGSKSRGRKVKN